MQRGSSASGLLWSFRAAQSVTRLCVSNTGGRTLAVTGELTVQVLDDAGAVVGRFKAGQPIRQVCVGADGSVLTALAGQSIIYSFTAAGEMEWRVELGGEVAAYALEEGGERLAAVGPGGWLYTYSSVTRERKLAPVGWPMAFVAAAGDDPPRTVVADEEGRVALLSYEGKAQWETKLGCRVGSVSAALSGGTVVVAAHEAGLITLGAGGRETARARLEADVLKAQAGPEGFPVLAELADGRLVLVDSDSKVLWERAFEPAPAPWALGAEGAQVVVVEEDRCVRAYGVRGVEEAPAAEAEPVLLRALPPEPGGEGDVEFPPYLEIEEAMGEGASPMVAPPKPQTRVAWKKRLPAAGLPVPDSLLRLGADGEFTVAVLADGAIVGLDRAGRRTVQGHVALPAEILPHRFSGLLLVRSGTRVVVLQLSAGTAREVSLAGLDILAFACAGDVSDLYVLDREGRLCGFDSDGRPRWRKALAGGEPRSLLVSPSGDTVLVADNEGRFKYFGRDGELQRKLRFGHGGQRAVLLADDFSVFTAEDGRLTVLNPEGRRIMSRKLLPRVTRVEEMDGSLAVYGEEGVCAAVDPREDRVWEFVPPPGRVLLRRRPGMDPLMIHAAGAAVTVFLGYRRKLDVVWRHRFSGDVELFDADADASNVLVLADGKIHRLEAGAG